MQLKTFFTFLFFIGSVLAFSQEKFTVSGTISEAETGETLIGVNVIIPSLQTGTVTNQYGYYSITLPKGEYEIVYSSIGFAAQKALGTLMAGFRSLLPSLFALMM